jgi:hypothetical protein
MYCPDSTINIDKWDDQYAYVPSKYGNSITAPRGGDHLFWNFTCFPMIVQILHLNKIEENFYLRFRLHTNLYQGKL